MARSDVPPPTRRRKWTYWQRNETHCTVTWWNVFHSINAFVDDVGVKFVVPSEIVPTAVANRTSAWFKVFTMNPPERYSESPFTRIWLPTPVQVRSTDTSKLLMTLPPLPSSYIVAVPRTVPSLSRWFNATSMTPWLPPTPSKDSPVQVLSWESSMNTLPPPTRGIGCVGGFWNLKSPAST